jgi:hypothetical protein
VSKEGEDIDQTMTQNRFGNLQMMITDPKYSTQHIPNQFQTIIIKEKLD